jgi:hypothetical protein
MEFANLVGAIDLLRRTHTAIFFSPLIFMCSFIKIMKDKTRNSIKRKQAQRQVKNLHLNKSGSKFTPR